MVLFCSSSLMTFSLPYNPPHPPQMFYKEQPLMPFEKKSIHNVIDVIATGTIKISSNCKHNARICIIRIAIDCTLNMYKIAYTHKTTLTKKNHLPLRRVWVNCPCHSISLVYDSRHHETGWHFLFYHRDMAPEWYPISLTTYTLLPLKYPYLREIQIPNYFISSSNTSSWEKRTKS